MLAWWHLQSVLLPHVHRERYKNANTGHYFIEQWITSQRMPLLFSCSLQKISFPIRNWRLLCSRYLRRNAIMLSTFLLNSKLTTSASVYHHNGFGHIINSGLQESFIKNSSLSYYLHAMKCTHLKYMCPWILIIYMYETTTIMKIQNISTSPPRDSLWPFAVHLFFHSQFQVTTDVFSLTIDQLTFLY